MSLEEPRFDPRAIGRLMREHGLGAAELARRVSVSKTLIGAWLSRTVTPQVGTLTRLCREFNVPIGYFFTTGDNDDGEPADQQDKAEVSK